MADPIVVKVSELTELSDVASGDLLTVVDVSESVVSAKTKKLQAQSLKIFNANQLATNVVKGPAIAGGSISLDKLAASLLPYLQAIKVNGLYFSTEATNPATSLGYGTWVAYAAGRIPIGVGTSDAAYAAGATGGESTHTLTATEMPVHTHVQDAHNHTQNAHNHTQNSHNHGLGSAGADGSDGLFPYVLNKLKAIWSNTESATATNVAATATNQAATATNQNAGSGAAHNNMPPYIAVYIWKRTA